jgi:ABC-type multidrug transport system permease subunit
VIGFGFLSGIWTAIGINPEGLLINALGSVLTAQYSDPAIRTFFLLLPTLILVVSVIGAYLNGRVPGLMAVLVAYVAGLVILSSFPVGLALICIAIIIAYYATRPRRR